MTDWNSGKLIMMGISSNHWCKITVQGYIITKHQSLKEFQHFLLFLMDIFLWICQVPLLKNRPFLSSPVPLFQNESKCKTFHMKMSPACSFIFMQIKVIFIRMVFALRLNLKQRHKGTRKSPICEMCYIRGEKRIYRHTLVPYQSVMFWQNFTENCRFYIPY